MDELQIKTERHGRQTTAKVTLVLGDEEISGEGTSLRSKQDVEFDQVGIAIAVGRAIQELGFELEMTGHRQCVTKEEYARVRNLIENRSLSAPVELRKQIEKALGLDPDEAASYGIYGRDAVAEDRLPRDKGADKGVCTQGCNG